MSEVDLKKRINELEEELENRNQLINNLPCTVSWINKDLEYISVNNELRNLFKEQLGSSVDSNFELNKVGFLKKQGNPFYEFIVDFFNSNKDSAETEFSTDITGEIKYHLIMAQKYKAGTEAVIIGFDVTDKRRLQEKIDKDERLRLIGQLTTGVIHEINNPLSVVMNYTDIIREKIIDGEADEVLPLLKRIDSMTERMTTIIDGLKNLGRDNQNAKKESSSLSKIIEEVNILIKNKVIKYKVDFNIDNRLGKDFELFCIEGRVIQVLINLIGNACEAFPQEYQEKEKLVNLCIDAKDNTVYFEIKDNGTGIPKELHEKIFEPFFTTKQKLVGTGMGLGLCKEIAKEHNGSLTLSSSKSGTTFTFTILNQSDQ